MGNPYLIPAAKTRKEPPDVMEVMAKETWQTELTAELNQISIRLGHQEGKEFKYLFPGAPLEWPDWYLEAVLSHELSVRVLRVKQEFEARGKNKQAQIEEAQKKLVTLFDPTGAKKEAQLENQNKFNQFLKDNPDWAKKK